MDETLLTPVQAGEYLNIKPGTLAVWRHKDRGPVYLKIGGIVRYRRSDLDDWLGTRVAEVVPSRP